MPFPKTKKAKRRQYYLENLEKSLAKRKDNYDINKDAVKASNSTYQKEKRRVNPQRVRAASSVTSKRCYQDDLIKHQSAKRARYHIYPEHSRALSRRSSKEFYDKDFEHA